MNFAIYLREELKVLKKKNKKRILATINQYI